ncbi:MAG: hypothetical protein JWO06_3097 [Bacteroidota bacterium]|nr:hypothetical protein [Bacteroidota bacterium]
MRWIKKGLIYTPNARYDWNKTHAQVPVVDMLDDKVWRIYYSSRNALGQSNCSFIEVEAGNPTKIFYEHPESILPFGKLGTFDDCGIMPTSIVNVGTKKYLYYVGWTVRQTVPYHNSIGLAVSDDGGKTFAKMFEGPVVTTIHTEPYFNGTAYVICQDNLWKMWYLSCTKWKVINNKPEPFYNIKYAESTNGINWKRDGHVAIDYLNESEGGIVSASVIKENGKYRMWYGRRSAIDYRTDKNQSYRIGYAESMNGKDWSRKDALAGIDVSPEGWDSEMISYPCVINYNRSKIMFYNGNGFGRTGFGYAILEE